MTTSIEIRHPAFGESSWNLRRGIHTSRQLWDAVSIVVPPMGDSVTEGSVATILKQPGEITELSSISGGTGLAVIEACGASKVHSSQMAFRPAK